MVLLWDPTGRFLMSEVPLNGWSFLRLGDSPCNSLPRKSTSDGKRVVSDRCVSFSFEKGSNCPVRKVSLERASLRCDPPPRAQEVDILVGVNFWGAALLTFQGCS